MATPTSQMPRDQRRAAVLRRLTPLLVALAASLPAAAAAQTMADAEREEDYVRVVQPQPFTRGGRFAVAPLFGLNINDPLVTSFTVGSNFTYFFKDYIGLTFGFHYSFDARRGAQNALLAQQVRPEINPLQWVGALGIEWVPIYGKFALFNRGITHWDVYLTIGGAAQNTQRGGVGPAGFLGVGTRLFLTSWLAINVEVRDYLYNESFTSSDAANPKQLSNFVNNLFFGAGVSFFFPTAGGTR